MKIEYIEIKELKERVGNPNQMSVNQMEALKKSITKFGELQPIIIDQDNEIVDGHHRKKAYEELKKDKIPVIRLDLKNEIDKKLLGQIMNKVKGTHDTVLDEAQIRSILEEVSMEDITGMLGVSEQNILNLLDSVNKESEEEKTSEVDNLYLLEVTCPFCNKSFKKKKE